MSNGDTDGQVGVHDLNTGFWNAATCRRFQEARHVAPARVRTSLQATKKRRPAGAIQKMKPGILAALFLVVSAVF